MTTVITISNQKGGCGKTTSVISLASALAMRGYTATVVDCDPQANATQAFGEEAEELHEDQYTVVDAYLSGKGADQIEMSFPDRLGGRLFLVPGSRGISTVQFRFDAHVQERLATQEITDLDADGLKDDQRRRLKNSLDTLRGKRDFVLVDTGPELGLVMTTALIAADYFIIPVIPSGYDLKGLKMLLKAVSQIRNRYRPDLTLLGVLLSKVKRTNLDKEIRDYLEGVFDPQDLFNVEIADSVRHREATLYGQSIHEHAPGEPASEQFMMLADEVLAKLGNPKPIDQSPEGEEALGDSEPVVDVQPVAPSRTADASVEA
ncbi:ParA family protein [Engelhardtia mirabilis]|uniref:MinD/ParA/CobQ/CobA-like protein n=1 Tax=Engelhardtia mirabilis TaxID=2528011 RepID=A0A518BT73_9BACT|nr:MinD/ParA/CobQ/CobA-like protein [Planctomycetes bacterium Pla133]